MKKITLTRIAFLLFHFFLISVLVIAQKQTVGLFRNDSTSFNGYTLFPPAESRFTYLIDNCGNVVNTWESSYKPGQSAYLLEDGSLLRTANVANKLFPSGGGGGRIEKYSWDGILTWSYNYSSNLYCQHHDIKPLPNGNILLIAWEAYTASAAALVGRDTSLASTVYLERLVEIKPMGTNKAKVVWMWHLADHIIQDFDPTKPNYGDVSQHPELIDINYSLPADIFHINSIDYNEELDQILISVHNFDEVWMIDHSTTTLEAKGHTGGLRGKGGDLLYRFGNPAAYQRGTSFDKVLNGQHDANWILDNYPDEGKIMVFNNMYTNNQSAVVVFSPAIDSTGNYSDPGISAFGPATLDWIYTNSGFYSSNISGARRQANGNTLICEGSTGHLFEIDSNDSIVWEYINPVTSFGPVNQGDLISNNSVFKCFRYAPDFSGFSGKDMTATAPVELNPWPSNCTIHDSAISIPTSLLNTLGLAMEIHLELTIYPNPSSGVFTIENSSNDAAEITFEIYNHVGQPIQNDIVSPNSSIQLDLSKNKSGLYFIKLINKDKISFEKIIIE